jgi:predicted Zn-dependent protease
MKSLINIALCGVAIAVVASAIRPQSVTAATAESTAQPRQSGIDSAGRLFQAGKFSDAGKLYLKIVAQNPSDYSAILQLVRIGLLSNRLDDAQKWLEKAITLQPENADAKVMLAEAFLSPRRFPKSSGFIERR